MAQPPPPPPSPSRWTNPLPISPPATTTSSSFVSSAFDSASFNLIRTSSSLPLSTTGSYANFWKRQSSGLLSPSLLSEDSSSSMVGMEEDEDNDDDEQMNFDLTLPDSTLLTSRHARKNSSDNPLAAYSIGVLSTPPPAPFLNRRLYAEPELNVDLNGARRTSDPVIEEDEDGMIGMGLLPETGSTSGSGEESRIVRTRALSRKPNLLVCLLLFYSRLLSADEYPFKHSQNLSLTYVF